MTQTTKPPHPPNGLTGEDVLSRLQEWADDGTRAAVATVISTWRSSPRPVGSQLAVAEGGAFVGSVSGGCVETAVIQEGLDYLQSGTVRRLRYGVTNEQAWEVGLPCGGEIEVFLGGVDEALLAPLQASRKGKRPVGLVTELESGRQRLFEWTPAGTEAAPAEEAGGDALRTAFRRALQADESRVVEVDGVPHFVHVFNPPARLVIVGAVHLAQVLAAMAQMANLDVVVVDPRSAFANAERFPGVELAIAWPEAALGELGVDFRTAVVTLSHDPKLDDPALTTALRHRPFYVGALGSRRSQAARRERLLSAGVEPTRVEEIHGPVGLDIGARTTAEIAISILADVVRALRSRQ